jgi:hypothetical protein
MRLAEKLDWKELSLALFCIQPICFATDRQSKDAVRNVPCTYCQLSRTYSRTDTKYCYYCHTMLNPFPKTQQGTSNVLHGTSSLNTRLEVHGMWGLSTDYMPVDR